MEGKEPTCFLVHLVGLAFFVKAVENLLIFLLSLVVVVVVGWLVGCTKGNGGGMTNLKGGWIGIFNALKVLYQLVESLLFALLAHHLMLKPRKDHEQINQ